MERLAERMAGQVEVARVDMDESPKIAQKFGNMSIPTILIIKNGEVVDRLVGVQPKATI